jgi:deazaflavin-dependent oxidoreductase (nitroreductase family)
MSERNERTIAEFRANGGVTEEWGTRLLVMHTIGARSGEERLAPVTGRAHDAGWYLVAANGGSPRHPAWYHNLVAHPGFDIEAHVDGEARTVAVVARELTGAEYDRVWSDYVERAPVLQRYADESGRVLPIFSLDRTAG